MWLQKIKEKASEKEKKEKGKIKESDFQRWNWRSYFFPPWSLVPSLLSFCACCYLCCRVFAICWNKEIGSASVRHVVRQILCQESDKIKSGRSHLSTWYRSVRRPTQKNLMRETTGNSSDGVCFLSFSFSLSFSLFISCIFFLLSLFSSLYNIARQPYSLSIGDLRHDGKLPYALSYLRFCHSPPPYLLKKSRSLDL